MTDTRIPPQDMEAEMATLGAMMIAPDCIGTILEVLPPGGHWFTVKAHEILFAALLAIHGAGHPVDLVVLENHLRADDTLMDVGGRDGILDAFRSVPSPANAEYYARIVREKCLLRRSLMIGRRLYEACYDHDASPADVLSAAQGEIDSLLNQSASRGPQTIQAITDDVIGQAVRGEPGKYRPLVTGFDRLDSSLNWLQPGQMVVIGARPSVGKTAFALNVLRSVAMKGVPALLFSLEMSAVEIGRRFVSMAVDVDSRSLQRPEWLHDDDRERISVLDFTGCPVFVDDRTGITTAELAATAKQMANRHKIGLVIVDYLGLMSDPRGAKESRQAEVANISRALKVAARTIRVPFMVLAQLNRDVEKTKREPAMNDLRDSGAIEQDADIILFIHRVDKQDPHAAQEEVSLIVRKNRNGPLLLRNMMFRKRSMTFHDISSQRENDSAVQAAMEYTNA